MVEYIGTVLSAGMKNYDMEVIFRGLGEENCHQKIDIKSGKETAILC